MLNSSMRCLAVVSLAVTFGVGMAACATPEPQPISEPELPKPAVSADTLKVLAGVEALQEEIRALRNQIELQQFELEKLKTRQQSLYDDLDRRLRGVGQNVASASNPPTAAGQLPNTRSTGPTLPPTATGSAPTLPPTSAGSGPTLPPTATAGEPSYQAGVAPQPSVTQAGTATLVAPTSTSSAGTTTATTPSIQNTGASQPTTQTPTVSSDQGAISTVQSAATTSAAVAPSPTPPTTEQDMYDQAFDFLKQSRYPEAIDGFEALLRSFPAGELADDSQYWIAETHYVTRDFEAAQRGFEAVMGRYPNSQRVPDALLKIGYLQYEVGAYPAARRTLNDVLTRYPGSRVAFSAETRLRKMDREGL